jgi:hypothetical protein
VAQYLRDCTSQHICPHYHASAATCGRIINIAMLALTVRAKIMGVQLPFAVFQAFAC